MNDRVWLLVCGAESSEWSYRIRPGRHTAGRAKECDICLLDGSVSRHHAEIEHTPTGLVIRDQGSQNGTFLNGLRIAQYAFGLGHTIGLGRVNLVVVAGTDAAPDVPDFDTTEGRPVPDAAERMGKNVGLRLSEIPVLRCFLRGLSEKEAAGELSLSTDTIHTHAKQIYLAFHVHSHLQLMALYLSRTFV